VQNIRKHLNYPKITEDLSLKIYIFIVNIYICRNTERGSLLKLVTHLSSWDLWLEVNLQRYQMMSL
jgi:hypothetical protein